MRALVEVPSLSLCALQQPGTHSFAYSFGRLILSVARTRFCHEASSPGSQTGAALPRVGEQNVRWLSIHSHASECGAANEPLQRVLPGTAAAPAARPAELDEGEALGPDMEGALPD